MASTPQQSGLPFFSLHATRVKQHRLVCQIIQHIISTLPLGAIVHKYNFDPTISFRYLRKTMPRCP